jgi:tetratricopeptide (TPR) repeat protein
MKAKKIVVTLLLIICILLPAYFFFTNNLFKANSANTLNHSDDLVIVKTFLEKGDKFRGSNQDSCNYYYNRAIEKSKLLPQDSSSNHLIALGYIGIAALNCNMGNYPESDKSVKTALEFANITNDKDIKAQAINIKGLLYYNQSNYDSAVICYQKALPLALDAANKKVQGKLHTNMAIINYLQGKCDLAIESFSKTLAIAEELQDVDLITGTFMNMGLVASNFGEYDKATGFYLKAIDNYEKSIESLEFSLKLSEEIGDKANIAKAHHNIAEVFARVGDYPRAMEEYLISIRQKEELNDKTALTDGYNGVGGLLCQQEQYTKALEYFYKSLKISEELNLVKGKSNASSNIASVYSAQHQYSQAIKFYQKALDLAIQINNKSGIADLNVNLGNTYSKMQQFDQAEAYLIKALSQKIGLGEKEGIAIAYAELANTEIKQALAVSDSDQTNCYKNAEEYALKAYSIAEELKSIPLVNTTSLVLKQAYQGLGNYPEALKFAEKFSISNDSLLNKSKTEAVTYAEARWSVEKQQKMIDLLQSQKDLQDKLLISKEKETNQQKIIIYFGIGLLILILAFTIIFAVYNRKHRDLLYQRQLNNLTVLKMQNISNRISPHFIFNMLSSISHSVDDTEKAKYKIGNLTMLLRNVIENIEHTAIPLAEELTIVQKFVELQKDKITLAFKFEINVEPDFNTDMLVPAMIIQIPAENALKHGLMPKQDGTCELSITAKKTESGSLISVIDNGIGLKNQTGKTSGTGTGLKMVMQTIQFLNSKNKNKIEFSIEERNQREVNSSGTIAEIFIPEEYSFQIQPER